MFFPSSILWYEFGSSSRMGRCCKQAKRKVMKPAVKEGLKEGLFSRVMEEEWAVGGELWSFGVWGRVGRW
jgi:hypothetical protein